MALAKLEITGRMSLQTSNDFLSRVSEALVNPDGILLSFDPSASLDFSNLQIVAALLLDARSKGIVVEFEGDVPDTLQSGIHACGLEAIFDLMVSRN